MKNLWKIVTVLVLSAAVIAVIWIKKSEGWPQQPRMATDDSNNVAVQASQITKSQKLPRLVDLGADKCIPCKMMAPILEGLKKEYQGRMDVVFIDVWKNPEEAKKYGIKIIPTQIFFNASGKELFRHEGFFSKEDILAKWKKFGVTLEKGTNNATN